MQPSDYASELRVYNKNGSLQYKYSFADSYITAVALNTDGTRAAVASTITHAGTLISRITVLDMSETEPIAEYESDGNLIFCRAVEPQRPRDGHRRHGNARQRYEL